MFDGGRSYKGDNLLSVGMGQEAPMDSQTVLLLFVEAVIVVIYLISLLLVVVRRAKKLIELRNRKYYFFVVFYIATKLILCSIVLVQVLLGIPESWKELSSAEIENIVKTAFIMGDLCVIELFLVSLQTYFSLCFSAFTDAFAKKRTRLLKISLQGLQLLTALGLLIPLAIFNVNQLDYDVLDSLAIGMNSFIIGCFLATFFYLNFKMTGVLMEPTLNGVIRRIYKLQLIILVSRAFAIAFEAIVATNVRDTFRNYIETISEDVEYEIVLGMLFVGTVLLILMAEGVPIMYSLRAAVVEALNFQVRPHQNKESLFTEQTSDLEQSFVGEREEEENKVMRLNSFGNLREMQADREEGIWVCKRGSLQGRDYFIRITKHEISSYILEDIDNEIAKWNQLNIKALSKTSYFKEAEIIHLVEKYYPVTLDQRVDGLVGDSELLRVGLQLAEAIHQFHDKDLVHGCLAADHVFFDGSQVVLGGCGLHSLRKYLSLITGYTNKSIYTATEHLKERSSVILKPRKPADIYSFGIILYEIVTGNRQYRLLPLSDITLKFADENFRPKLPPQIKLQIKNLIRRCWHESVQKRPTIGEVMECLRALL